MMNIPTRTKIIGVLLLLVSLWSFYSQTDEKQSQPNNTQSSQGTLALAPSVNQAVKQIDIESEEKLPWGRNPFSYSGFVTKDGKPAPSSSPFNVSWQLSGIIYNPNLPVAIINKQAVQVGDTVGNAKVLVIHKDKVIIEYNGDKIELMVTRG